jgi:hypothetical protein
MAESDKNTVTQPPADRQKNERSRRPYEPPRITGFDIAKSILGPAISPTADGASGTFRP